MEAIKAAATFSLTGGRPESGSSSSNGALAQKEQIRTPRLPVSKPSWIIRTKCKVGMEGRKKADPPCVVCGGSGRVDCSRCNGRGRTNHVELEVLPQGKWPEWCRYCSGSGLSDCSRCLGTGKYRHTMGFDFMYS
ncbi:unnamed protein product [Cuscuta europaea]|uniref:Uncharacterized protein n=2 Tax=Cuscuta europaea TaxID=41803 RepID=A0A9P0ZD68_CUSEU|nr:unnamed protein product [Cuscuta europaea]